MTVVQKGFQCCRAFRCIYNFIKMHLSLYPSTWNKKDNIQFSMHRCNSVSGWGKMRIRKAFSLQKAPKGGQYQCSQRRCFHHSNIKLQRISCLNWLHKCNSWWSYLCFSCWNKVESESWIISRHLVWGRKGCWGGKKVCEERRGGRELRTIHWCLERTNSTRCHEELEKLERSAIRVNLHF